MPQAQVTMNVRDAGGGAKIIDIEGEITAFAEEVLTEAHEEATGSDVKAVILNFEGLEYMNSGGIGLLVTTLIRAQRSGHKLLAFGLSDHYRQIFSLTRLDDAIHIYPDEMAALAAI